MNKKRLNPLACAMAIPPRSMELTIKPCELSFDYILEFEKAGEKKRFSFSATLGDLIQFRDAVNHILP